MSYGVQRGACLTLLISSEWARWIDIYYVVFTYCVVYMWKFLRICWDANQKFHLLYNNDDVNECFKKIFLNCKKKEGIMDEDIIFNWWSSRSWYTYVFLILLKSSIVTWNRQDLELEVWQGNIASAIYKRKLWRK